MTIDEFQKTIGIKFKNEDLLNQAFTHRSYLNEDKKIKTSNERLEFLGDAILAFLTSHFLYKEYPQFPEGTLTNVRSSLVKTQSLANIASILGMGNLLKLSKGEEDSGGRSNPSLLADVFEAFLGALYLDTGIEAVAKFLGLHLFPKAAEIVSKKSYIDYKSLLQEIIQEESRISPTYRVVRTQGPDHQKTFWVEAVSDKTLGGGSGKSKQEAEQQAALDALERLGKI